MAAKDVVSYDALHLVDHVVENEAVYGDGFVCCPRVVTGEDHVDVNASAGLAEDAIDGIVPDARRVYDCRGGKDGREYAAPVCPAVEGGAHVAELVAFWIDDRG